MKTLGRYELKHVLGEGGMGVVWEAVLVGPAGFRKPVALKVLSDGGAGLVHEARLGGLLRHPNLVEVYALEQVEGTWVCAMELVTGGTLARRSPLPAGAVVEIGRQVCAGLAHAHQQIGLVHLDLKPSNLLLDGQTVKIADFGIARARGFQGRSRIRGTPAYMSPEQAVGGPLDARSDLWSLGVCLFELATGRLPVHDSGAATTWSTLELDEAPVPGMELALDQVPWLAPVLARCLAEDPEQRWESAEALDEALAGIDTDGPGLAEALGRSDTPAPVPRRTSRSTGTLTRREPTQTNLAEELDAFVGRREELEALDRLLRHGGLVTLKGMGGSGKTRLARQYGERWRRATRGQSWFVDLAAARTRWDVLGAVAEVLGVPLGGGSHGAMAVQLGRALEGRDDVLLILDNFEQVLDCADLASGWASETVRVLVTSREPLQAEGEQVLELDPLPEPDAVDLLIARARDRGAEIADDPDLPELARRLDGLPLALELAAGRMTVMTPGQVLARLDQRLKLLGGGVRGGRQATLRATLDGSWEVLEAYEQAALGQLSVFRGGFELELAEPVLALGEEAPWALDVLESLVRRSLVRARPGSLGTRFELLESVRVYADQTLSEADRATAEARHGQAMATLGFGGRARSAAYGDLGGWERLARDVDNLVVACERAVERGDVEVAADCLGAAAEVLDVRGPHTRTLVLVDAVSELELPSRARARVDLARARVLRRLGRYDEAVAQATAVRERLETEGRADDRYVADAMNQLGTLYRRQGRAKEGLALLEEAEARYRGIGDRLAAAIAVGNQAGCLYNLSDIEGARQRYERALRERRDLKDRRGTAHLLANLAVIAQVTGQLGVARRHHEEALRLHRGARDRRGEALALANLGVLAVDQGQFDRAERRWLEALELRRTLGEKAGEGVLLGYLATLAIERGTLDKARVRAEEALERHRIQGSRRHIAAMVATLGGIALYQGRLDEAAVKLREARDAQSAIGDRVGFGITCTAEGQLARARGDLDQAWTLFDGAVEAIGGRHVPSQAQALAWRGLVSAERGDRESAERDLDQAQTLVQTGGVERGLALVWLLRALALEDRAALEKARELGWVPGSPTGLVADEVEATLEG